MSLTIFPQAFSVGFTPKASPTVSQPMGLPPNQGVNAHQSNVDVENVDVQVDLSHMEAIKIIPDEEGDGGSDSSSDGTFVNHKTAFRINANSDDVVVKIIDPETGEEVREIPDTSQQELSQRIRAYQDLAFEDLQ